MANQVITAVKETIRDYVSLKGYVEDQNLIKENIRQGISFKGTNCFILIFAILVASLGLNTNSTAVIIGAMLISPLMGPIIGIGMAIGIMDFDILRQSLRNLLVAALVSVLVATLFFLVSPVGENHSELLARTSPTIYDVLIAFFGGAAGIIGMSSNSKGNVIPGVAIATALMPPLCTAGYGLATAQFAYFFGALYLFIINSIFIALSTFIGVKLMHFDTTKIANPLRAAKVRRWVYIIAVLTVLPSIYLTYNMLRQNRFAMHAERFVNEEMNFSGTQVLSRRTYQQGDQRVLEVTLLGRIMPQDSLMMALTPQLAKFGLKGVKLNIIQGGQAPIASQDNQSVAQVYDAAQKAIMARQGTIDSLRTIVNAIGQRDTIGAAIAPELRVVFPQVSTISVSRNVFCDITTGKMDTAEVALVRYRSQVGQMEQNKLARYLEARLGAKRVHIIQL